jgi:hypothetical protein
MWKLLYRFHGSPIHPDPAKRRGHAGPKIVEQVEIHVSPSVMEFE